MSIKNSILFIFALFIGCKNDNSSNRNVNENTLTYDIDFPSTVYVNKKYKGKISFYNAMFDTIVEPRSDTTNFRAIIYKPFKPHLIKDQLNIVYKDSILLEKNTIDIEFTFDKPGVYNIGGLARDGMMIGYYTEGKRDSVRIIEDELILFHKVVVKDSI